MLANERFVANAPERRRRGRAREARALPPRARCARRLTGSNRSRRGRRSSASGGCTRSWPSSAIRSARFRAIHVVGTNGKSTATRRAAAFLLARGPERRRVHLAARRRLERADPGRRRGRRPRAGARARSARRRACRRDPVRGADGRRARRVRGRAASRPRSSRPGLGGRLDATNVLDAQVVALTNVALDHTDVLGETREAIADEKLAVVAPGATVVLGEPEWESRARAEARSRSSSREDVGRAAAEALLGRALDGEVEVYSARPFRRASATTSSPARTTLPASSGCSSGSRATTTWSSPRSSPTRTPRRCWPRSRGRATRSWPPSRTARGLCPPRSSRPAHALLRAGRARRRPRRGARARARAGGRAGAVLVTGSLYLLADLTVRLQRVPWGSSASG